MTEQTTQPGPSASDVAQKVAEYLKDRRPGGVSVAVDPHGVQQAESSWRVRVRPSKEPAKLFKYYEALADVEIELEEREQLNVWLVTSDPEHPPSGKEDPQSARDDSPPLSSIHRPKRRTRGTKPVA